MILTIHTRGGNQETFENEFSINGKVLKDEDSYIEYVTELISGQASQILRIRKYNTNSSKSSNKIYVFPVSSIDYFVFE